jgi:hypothetical protein
MTVLFEIGLKSIEIMTLVFGILGMSLSLLLLISPRTARNLSRIFDRSIDTDQRLAFLDKDIRTDNLIYSHRFLVGGFLVAGSMFALLFLFFKFDALSFAEIFFGSRNYFAFSEMLFQAIAGIGKLSCLLGLILGCGLMAVPEKMRAIERRLNTYVDTRSFIEKLDRSGPTLDTVFLRYPFFCGLLGGSVSLLLIVLSIINLLR